MELDTFTEIPSQYSLDKLISLVHLITQKLKNLPFNVWHTLKT